jgi:formylglycine-generating enzyme required for sulfatase activity
MAQLPGSIDRETCSNAHMVHVPGGRFRMGSDAFYPEERPVRLVEVDGFWIDTTPVTNAGFARFVAATGHVTCAEKAPDPAAYPDADPGLLVPGSLVFGRHPDAPSGPPSWHYCPGANWRLPQGLGSGIESLGDHPVVHVTYRDALTYAEWAGKDLPTEAEWEYACRGGRNDPRPYQWGEELAPSGRMMANYWQGHFPDHNACLDGWEFTSMVASFPPNGLGLYDMIGNVWEWTRNRYSLPSACAKTSAYKCCIIRNPRSADEGPDNRAPAPGSDDGFKVVKGGSFLCAENFCQRYRPPARQPQAIDTSSCHIGFRCVSRG